MTKKDKEPMWFLTEEAAIGIDSYNWRLYTRVKDKKTNKPAGWKIAGYYPNLEKLAHDMGNTLLMQDKGINSMEEHFQKGLQEFQQAISRLKEEMDKLRVGLKTLPRKYADF